ncbi:MAG: hypothetical protein SFU91_05655 [Chloroherpetonaceae bacterium]|nr:hypothetical protein [Chloroherpetonaceae bacterium]
MRKPEEGKNNPIASNLVIKLQNEAAQVGFEASIVGNLVYIASEFQYFRFENLNEAKEFLREKRNEKLARLYLNVK